MCFLGTRTLLKFTVKSSVFTTKNYSLFNDYIASFRIWMHIHSLSHVGHFCSHMDCSPPGSSVHGISQARILKWVVIFSPQDLPNPGTEPASPTLAGRFFTTGPPEKPQDRDTRDQKV